MMYGKIIDGVFHKAPYTYTIGGVTIDNFDHDIPLMTELGYKEVVTVDVPIDTRYRYISTYEERDGKIYETRVLDDSEELLDDLKARRIAQTREDLAIYLEGNPLVSACKGGVEKKYTVTLEKQNQLTSTVTDFLSNALPIILAGTPIEQIDLPIYWNAQGDICEKWTYAEIYRLKNEMMSYVRPIVEYQRYLEKTIMEQDTQDKIYELDCHFIKDKIDKFIASRNEAPKDEVVDEVPEEPTNI